MKVDENIFRVKLFEDLGYVRKRCRSCNAFFWTLKDVDTCGDSPCEEYTFFDIKTKRLSYREVRERFLRFFERHGHAIVEPRPVVARWREDLYLTIASIVVFQPHVTSGLVPPPANPLVIAQPCIRLEDIDNVGLTFGRHLTNFIMGGHHAFNYPNKFVYWTNETVEYAYKFFVEEIGVPPEELRFKESWWEGGGNAGPCFEVSVGGLEVATLVFMMFRSVDGRYEEMDLKIVDTGYGIERIAWLSQRTPTAFHAVYGELVPKFFKIMNVVPPSDDVLYEAVRIASRSRSIDVEIVAEEVARRLGIDAREVREQLTKAIDVFALLDFSKTIALMLSDGIVPSNSGEGYLARLVIRRALRKLSRLGVDVPLLELVKMQVDYWSDLYPRMTRMWNYIEEVLRIEEDKYREVLKRITTIAPKFVKKKPSLEELITLYDSQGVPPDLLKEYLEKRFGVSIEVPSNFYSIVASRHSKPQQVREFEKEKLPKDIASWASRFPATRRLFHEDPYLRTFRASILGVLDRYVVLDQTAFYPEGGGQLGDRGTLRIGSETYRVVDTQKVGDVIVHILERPVKVEEGTEVVGEIDWSCRYRKMKHHTATHILLGALRRVLGEHVWQAGAEKTETKARLDVTHFRLPTKEEIAKIEALVNNVIEQALPVKVHLLPRNRAEELYGFVLYQGGVPMTPVIRVVEIPGWDYEACFGTHVRNTSEVGAVKIINVEKIADGIVRFEFTASTALKEYTDSIEQKLVNVAQKLGASATEVDRRVDVVLRELEDLRKLVKTYRSIAMTKLIEDLLSKSTLLGPVRLVIYRHELPDQELLRSLLMKLIEIEPRALIVAYMPRSENETFIELSLGKEAVKFVDARTIVNEMKKYVEVRAGGKPDHVSGIVKIGPNDVQRIVEEVVTKLIKR